jgi:hypothetical protein
MRKRLLLLLFVVFTMPAVSQNVVRYGDPCYLFNAINFSDIVISPYPGNPAYIQHCCFDYGTEYNVPDNTPIYGIAATLDIDKNITDSAGYTMYLYTVINGNNLVCLDSITKFSRETQYVYAAMNDTVLVESPVPCYEYFFSQPHVLQGTIYIGARRKGQNNQGSIYFGYDSRHMQRWVWLDANIVEIYMNGLPNFWGCYFPIVMQENIECTASVPEVSEMREKECVLTWEMEGDSCQLSITPSDMPVDSGLVIDLQNNTYTISGLENGRYYAARLRTQCHHHCPIHSDTLVWSDWGTPTVFYFGTQGIGAVAAAPEWNITPNPAHRSATVRCDEGIKSVELLSVKGEALLHKDMADEKACTLDLSGLSKGIYIVQITTPQGTAARKLAVE